ncbi:MAG: ATP-binding protein [Acidobacteria bacterium]|jgi:hypothetical protein|nr:ATP-binding protein [Acidobacteriota bacterium]
MFLPRLLEAPLLESSSGFPALLLTGARQVGKTTLLQHAAEREGRARRVVSLDEFGPRGAALEDPELFLQRYPPPVLIDEVQHAPRLLEALKPAIDRGAPAGSYWLSGSQPLPLMRGVSESLAGRVGVLALFGLSLAERSGWPQPGPPFRPDRPTHAAAPQLGLLELFERILQGGLPRLAHSDAPPREVYLDSYLQTYIERDVRLLSPIGDLARFQRFLRVAAFRVGQLLNVADMARDVGVAPSTAHEWLHLLEATGQVYLLRPYFENIGKRQIKSPKLYFLDTGIAAHLAGWSAAEPASRGAMAGALFENLVVTEILKSYRHRGREAPIWYFRDKERHEVDLLVAEDGLLFPVEAKLTASPGPEDIAGYRALQRAGAPLGPGAVICLVPDRTPLGRELDAVPVTELG